MRIYLTVGLLVSCILFGCKKPHHSCSNPPPCEVLPECYSITEPEYYTADTVWSYMSLNPSNANEIVTWKWKAENLISRNITTGVNSMITPVNQIISMKWGKDWILYNRWKYTGYGEIYKIKPDGSGKQLLTEGYYSFYPTMNPAGNLFVHFKIGKIEIFDMNGNHVKETLPPQIVGSHPYDWFTDSLLLSYDPGEGIYLTNVFTGVGERIITNPNSDNISNFGCPVFIGHNEFVWLCNEGLMKTNMQTKETTKFIQSCSSILYYPIGYDGTQNRILCGKTYLSNIDNKPCKIFSRTDVIWIDADNAKETLINMDNL